MAESPRQQRDEVRDALDRLLKAIDAWAGDRREGSSNRGKLAILRRGLRPADRFDAERFALIDEYVKGEIDESDERLLHEVTALCALHPRIERTPTAESSLTRANFGNTLAAVYPAAHPRRRGVARRLTFVLSGTRAEVLQRLLPLFRQLHGDAPDHPVNYLILFRDVRSWDSDDRWVQRAWARSFWGGLAVEPRELAETSDASNDETTTNDDPDN